MTESRMNSIVSRRAAFALAWATAVACAALSACSLGLGSEDEYFATPDTASMQAPRNDAAPGVEAVAPADGGLASADTSVPETPPPDAQGDVATGGDSGPRDSAIDVALPPAVLQLYYSFDDDAGTATIADHSGNNLSGELKGDTVPLIDPLGHLGRSLMLDGTQHQYVQLPAGVVATLESLSVACWMNLKVPAIWNRLFDFNAGSTVWMYFSPTGWNPSTMQGGTHFAISSGAHLDPEMILTDTVPVGAWHHIAVVLSAPYLIYYFDGVEKVRMTNMTLGPKDLGSTPQNWIGRSSYSTDPYLSASVDEFRIYSGALTAQEVAQLASQ